MRHSLEDLRRTIAAATLKVELTNVTPARFIPRSFGEVGHIVCVIALRILELAHVKHVEQADVPAPETYVSWPVTPEQHRRTYRSSRTLLLSGACLNLQDFPFLHPPWL